MQDCLLGQKCSTGVTEETNKKNEEEAQSGRWIEKRNETEIRERSTQQRRECRGLHPDQRGSRRTAKVVEQSGEMLKTQTQEI